MTGPRTSVVNSALVLYGQTDFGPGSSKWGNGTERGAHTMWELDEDPVLSASALPTPLEMMRAAVRRARRNR